MLDFSSSAPPESVPNNQDIPKEMDIFFKSEASFLPNGKTYNDLTPEEYKALQEQYRFSPFRPGMYQSISGMNGPGRGGMM